MKRILTIFFLFLALLSEAKACICVFREAKYETFLELANKVDIVVKVKIKRYSNRKLKGSIRFFEFSNRPRSMKAKVLQTYGGEIESKKIKIWGDYGWDCRTYIPVFNKKSEYYLALIETDTSIGRKHEKIGQYVVLSCGEYFLPINSDSVNGAFDIDNPVVFKIEKGLATDQSGEIDTFTPEFNKDNTIKKKTKNVLEEEFQKQLIEIIKTQPNST